MPNLFRCTGGGIDNLTVVEREYDPKEVYYIDDTRVRNGQLYICLEDNTTGEWDASKWQATYLSDLVGVGHVVRNATQVVNSLHVQQSSYSTYSGTDTFTASQDLEKAKLIVNVLTSLDNYSAGNTGYDFDRIALTITSDNNASIEQKNTTNVLIANAVYSNSNIRMGSKSFIFDITDVSEGEIFTISEQFGKSAAHYAGITCVTAFLEYDTTVYSNPITAYYLGTGTSFDIKTILPNIDYTKLTTDNFLRVTPDGKSASGANGYYGFGGDYPASSVGGKANLSTGTMSYDPSTGILTAPAIYASSTGYHFTRGSTGNTVGGVSISCEIYLLLGDIQKV